MECGGIPLAHPRPLSGSSPIRRIKKTVTPEALPPSSGFQNLVGVPISRASSNHAAPSHIVVHALPLGRDILWASPGPYRVPHSVIAASSTPYKTTLNALRCKPLLLWLAPPQKKLSGSPPPPPSLFSLFVERFYGVETPFFPAPKARGVDPGFFLVFPLAVVGRRRSRMDKPDFIFPPPPCPPPKHLRGSRSFPTAQEAFTTFCHFSA